MQLENYFANYSVAKRATVNVIKRKIVDMENKLFVTWEEYFKLCDNLVEQIKKVAIPYTDIVAIARGGLIPAQYLAYKLNIKQVYNYGIITYTTDNKKRSENYIYQKAVPLEGGLRPIKRILIVDDIADSGKTVDHVYWDLRLAQPEDISVCTLHYKPHSIFTPKYYAQEVSNDRWVVYPYDEI